MIQVLKVVERVLLDGSEQQKWAVTHFLMTSLQASIRESGHATSVLLPYIGPATAKWWNDLTATHAQLDPEDQMLDSTDDAC